MNRCSGKHGINQDEENNIKPNFQFKLTADLINWMLRANFSTFFGFSMLLFIILTFIFALVIMAFASLEPRCVTSSTFQANRGFIPLFIDAWNLSWTTFSTVGYGNISPSTSMIFVEDMDKYKQSGNCFLMGTLLSFESLVGILCVSFAGAIIYVKLIQFQTRAKIKFSSIMVLKYGTGVRADDFDYDDEESSASEEDEDDTTAALNPNKIPCPVLLFRMANLLHSRQNGAIVNAHVKTVATVDIKNTVIQYVTRGNTVFRDALNIGKSIKRTYRSNRVYTSHLSKRRGPSLSLNALYPSKKNRKGFLSLRSMPSSEISVTEDDESDTLSKHSTETEQLRSSQLRSSQLRSSMIHFDVSNKQMGLTNEEVLAAIDDIAENISPDVARTTVPIPGLGRSRMIHGETELEMPNMVFANVEVDPGKHPYFRTSWRCSHTLNADSPLLTKATREKIRNAGGYWPSELNNADDVEKSIDFDQFLVSFRGLSKATGNEVFDHQVYKMKDIRFGHQFKSILIQNVNKTIGVEPDYIDETKIQSGGLIQPME